MTLVDSAALARHIDDPRWCVVDCRFALDDPEYGERAYAAAHIAHAHYAHLDRDLAGPAGAGGRHPLPERGAMAACLSRWGVTEASQLVAYDDANGMFAARLWWLARWLGHERAAVLDGGIARWRGPSSAERPTPEPSAFTPRAPLTRIVEARDILENAGYTLLDARAYDRYAGKVEPIDAKAGHIAGALSVPFADNVLDDGQFREPDALAVRFAPHAAQDVVCYCGSGVSAAHNILAMCIAGLPEPALYPGSWSEWIQDPSRPTEP